MRSQQMLMQSKSFKNLTIDFLGDRSVLALEQIGLQILIFLSDVWDHRIAASLYGLKSLDRSATIQVFPHFFLTFKKNVQLSIAFLVWHF